MTTNFQDILAQLARQQSEMQAKITWLAQTLNDGVAKTKKSSVQKPDPFTGKHSDVWSFLAKFETWAKEQKDLTDDEKMIMSALSFMQGDAAVWAAPYVTQTVTSKRVGSDVKFPFKGDCNEFEEEFKTSFGAIDEEAEATSGKTEVAR
jgi:hypothetical protein